MSHLIDSIANTIGYAVRRLDGCRALLGALVLLLLVPVAQAEVCQLSYEQGALDAGQLSVLAAKNYVVYSVPRLSSDLLSLRNATNPQRWGLVQTRKGFELYFEMPTGMGQFPMLRYPYPDIVGVPHCSQMKKQINYLASLRLKIKDATAYLRGDGSLLDAFIAEEEADAISRRKTYPADYVRGHVKQILEASAKQWNGSKGLAMASRLQMLRELLIMSGLKNYCRDFPRLQDLAVRKCTNCVGQTLLWLAVADHLKLSGPGVLVGFILYSDHIAPAMISVKDHLSIDLFSGNKLPQGMIVQDPRWLVGSGIRKWPSLVFEWDKTDSKWLGGSGEDEIVNSSKMRDERNPIQRTDVFNFKNLSAKGRFSEGPVPEFADLLERSGSSGGSNGRSRECETIYTKEVTEVLVADLIPEDRAALENSVNGGDGPCDHRRFMFNKNIIPAFTVSMDKEPDLGDFPFRSKQQEYKVKAATVLGTYNTIAVIKTAYFADKRTYLDFFAMPYKSRWAHLISMTQVFIVEKLLPDLDRLIGLMEAPDTIPRLLAGYNDYQRISRSLSATVQAVYLLNVHEPALRPKIEKLLKSMDTFSKRMAQDYQNQIGLMNALEDPELQKLHNWFAELNLPNLEYAALQYPSSNPLDTNPASYTHPLEEFFLAVLRNSTWKPVARNWELHVPPGPLNPGHRENLIVTDLPRVDLPCGDHGGLVVVCEKKTPEQMPEVALKKLKPSLLAMLGMTNYHRFFNPGDLLMLSSVWTEEVQQGALLLDRGVKHLREVGPEEFPSTLIETAIDNRVAIIRGESDNQPDSSALRECRDFSDYHSCEINVFEGVARKQRMVQTPGWINEHPMFASLLATLPSRPAVQCELANNFGYAGYERVNQFHSHGDVTLMSYNLSRPTMMFRAKTKVGNVAVDYVLAPDTKGCQTRYGVHVAEDEKPGVMSNLTYVIKRVVIETKSTDDDEVKAK